jgi:ferric-dicitrate binding protein FerR (iron transport regulator)
MDNNYEAYQYAALIVKHLRGELSAVERTKLNEWIKKSPENALLLEKLLDEGVVKTELDFLASIDTRDAWQNILLRTNKVSFTHKVFTFVQKWKYAAIILAILSVGIILYRSPLPDGKQTVAVIKRSKYKNDIPPGTDKARLTLADGSVVVMDGHTSGMIKGYAGLNITSDHGLLSYKLLSKNTAVNSRYYNIINTPAGCKYKVTLPDGTMVWLNSESSLKFPVVFSGNERRVYLTGEAYFEVAKNKHKPFKVFSNHTVVRVLGTHFNVSAYHNEEAVKVTLLEGSVQISNGNQSKMIVPGEQASIKRDALVDMPQAKINVATTDVNESVAWKNNLFLFDSEDVESVMKKIARWYNVNIEYRDGIPQTHFSGSISRNNNISQILNMLELTGGVHFSIDGRKVIVTR